ncbi:MAG: UDP-N-acetylglucosamine--N-acetylmuramyl-(pentapeptide) pyrophosphoryl-undecaprenol N-acetylglucosamine transferase, partial [Phaeodactylibacter sp.]|nr:UDP-N-acetylglucosamine--N-acetylmuramyl-(pentapeptide) pyrophosphoryl-undecaprenol N-acetylglucosamine transferase [Phaeodactylibacter sp.]
AELLAQHPEVQVIWQCGKLYIDTYKNCATAQLPNVQLLEFIDRMDLAYEVADVVVSRAGALTISELCLVGKPVVLIPSPNVAEDHQTKNAKALADRDAAILLPDPQAGERIIQEPLDLLQNTARRQELGANIKALAKPDAAEQIAAAVLELGQKRK